MIGSPDLVAFTKDTYFKEISPDPLTLPEEFSVPLYPCTGSSTPWAKILDTNFKNDFILLAEFSEQVGPQPLLTVPPGTKACGTFDLNYFSLRIMSVDYQSSLTGPSSSGSPKLNFVEDSQVVLGDSKEGAFAYVHHLTLYDLEARGFVRPLCLAYVSSDENKILQQFELLSAEFSRVSECLKTGNRKNFAVELENKIRSLERERVELLKDLGKEDKVKSYGENTSKLNGNCALDQDVEDGTMKEETPDERNDCEILNVSETDETCSRLQNNSDIASRKTCAIADNEVHRTVFKYDDHEKNQEELCPVPLASKAEGLEKRIREYKGLLKQVTSYLTRKLRDSEYSPYEPEDLPQTLEFEWDELKEGHLAGPMEEPSIFNEPTEPQTPNYNNAATSQFDKRLKTLEELCNTYFHQQALQQLHSIERSFRGDACYLYTQNRCHRLLRNLRATNFLFEDPYRSEEEDSQIGSTGPRLFQQASLLALSNEPISLESYASCVEMVPIKLECIERLTASNHFTTESSSQNHPFSDFHTSILPTETLVQIKSEETLKKVADECCSVVDCSSALMKSSISSGESIEVLGTEKSFRTQNSSSPVETDFQRSPITPAAINGQKRRRVTTKRMYSEESIEVLSTTESIIPEDLRAFTCVIDEECLDQDSCEKDRTESQVGNAYTMGRPEEDENGCIEEPKSSCPIIRISPPDNPSLLQTSIEDTRQRTESIPFLFLEEPSHSAGDDLSECFSYRSNTTSTASDCTLSSCLHGDKRLSGTRKRQRRGRIGRAALQFLRQFPFAVQAVFSLLSGRTLVVVGSEEATVKQLVTALSIYTPNLGKYRESVQPWTSAPLQLTDLLKWKLIGFNRACSQTPGLPHSLGHFNRYIGILDVDQKTLRCPVYSGSLLNQLVAPMNHITRGNTYFWLAQSVLNQLVNKAFLLTFSHRLHTLRSQHNAQEVALLSDLHNDDVKILDYLSELIKLQFLDVPPNVLRFGYTTSSVFKL